MNTDRWRRIEEVFQQASDLEAGDRETLLAGLAADEPEVAAEVLELLAADAEIGDRVVAEALAEDRRVGGAASDGTTAEGLGDYGPFRAVEVLGSGGMGTVYLGERVAGDFEQRVALKVVRAQMATAGARERFVAERRILASLEHDGIARLIDGGMADDGPWFAMELVEGRPLFEATENVGLAERLEVFLRICEAVHHAHRNLVVHRDLKPSNILVKGGVPKLLDFGIAKVVEPGAEELTRDGQRAMTPAYAAPEQLSGESVTTATDVYALGVLLYELLCGVHPFESERDSPMLYDAILHSQPTRPSRVLTTPSGVEPEVPSRAVPGLASRQLSGDLDNICLMALRKEPERRYASAADLAADVRAFLDRRPVTATPDSLAYRVRRFVDRNRVPVGLVAGAGVLIVALTVFYGLRLQRERDLARSESTKARQVSGFLTELFSAVDPSNAQGREVTARELLDQGVRRIEAGLQDQAGVRAELLLVMGDVHMRLGLYDRATDLLQRAESLAGEVFGESSAEAALAITRQAETQLYQEQLDEAIALFDRAIERQRTLLPASRAGLAEAIDLKGRALRFAKKFDESEALQQEAYALRLAEFGAGSLPVAESLQSLALLNQDRGKVYDSADALREALAIRQEILGLEHPETLELQQNLASVMPRIGDAETGIALYREILPALRAVYGPEDRRVGYSLSGLAYCLQRVGRLKEAIDNDRQAVAIFRATGGGPPGLTGLIQLARHLTFTGEFEEAELNLRLAVEWLEDTPEDPSPQRSNVLIELGSVLTEMKQWPEAEQALRETLELDLATYGDDHTYVAQDRYKIGDLLRASGDPAAALPWFERALERQRRLRKGENALGRTLTSQGEALLDLDRVEDAVASLREAVEVFEVDHSETHPDFGAARSGYGEALRRAGDPAGALAQLEPAAGNLAQELGAEHPWTELALERLAKTRGR